MVGPRKAPLVNDQAKVRIARIVTESPVSMGSTKAPTRKGIANHKASGPSPAQTYVPTALVRKRGISSKATLCTRPLCNTELARVDTPSSREANIFFSRFAKLPLPSWPVHRTTHVAD